MITAVFKKTGGNICAFHVEGHSGYAESGSDIVCAAVSAMIQLTVNTIAEYFGTKSELSADTGSAAVDFSFDGSDARAVSLASSFCGELKALQNDYPGNIRVIVK